jgi:GDPmannose 4,6-dehydratase
LDHHGITKEISYEDFELLESSTIMRILKKYQPDEFYNLAAQSFVKSSFETPVYTGNTTGLGVTRILDAIKQLNPATKFYQASSSEMFGKVIEIPQKETTPFFPRSPYAVAKAYAHWMTVNYREAYNLYCCSGMLFNHESPLRGSEFVTKKITSTMAKIKLNKEKLLEVGNINAKRDWGFAGDYVEAMHLMLNQNEADDYVICTGETHTVKEFIDKTAEVLSIKIAWEGEEERMVGIDKKTNNIIIKVNEEYYRPAEVDILLGDYQKAKEKLGWSPKCTFDSLVEMMVEADLKFLQ